MITHKSPKIAELLADCQNHPLHDAHYLGYFQCFNAQLYYEAHDVLEELWLDDKNGPNGNFYKGLIQVAGGFVHLKLHYQFPSHRVHGQRLEPAARLFQLAINNFAPYPSSYHDLNLDAVRTLCDETMADLMRGHYQQNPWLPPQAPQLKLL